MELPHKSLTLTVTYRFGILMIPIVMIDHLQWCLVTILLFPCTVTPKIDSQLLPVAFYLVLFDQEYRLIHHQHLGIFYHKYAAISPSKKTDKKTNKN